MSRRKKRAPTVADYHALTPAQLRDLANNIDDRVGDMLIDEDQINEEAGYDQLAAWRALAEYLRAEAKRREAAK